MSPATVGFFVQGTRRPWAINITSTVGGTDLSVVTSVDLFVRRGVTQDIPAGTSTETWATTGIVATATTLTATNTPTASGVGSVTVAPERLTFRPILHFAAGPDVECTQFFLSVGAK